GAFAGEGFVALCLPDATEERYGLGRTRLAGRHNVENILAAVTAARLAGAPPAAVQAAIDEIEPLPHRLARVAERGGVAWYDDSKATNAGAAAKSLDAFAGAGRARSAGAPRLRRPSAVPSAGNARACGARSAATRGSCSRWRRSSG